MADKKAVNKVLPVLGTSALGAGLLLHIVGVSTSAWMIRKDNSDTTLGHGTGMFTLCDTTWQCDQHDTEPAQLMAVQAMACFGLVLAAVALTLALRHVVRSLRWGIPDPEVLVNMVLLTSLCAGILILFATIIYAMEILHKWTVGPLALNKLKLGYSLKLSVAGAIFILIGGFITVGGANKEETPTKKTKLENFTFTVLREDAVGIVREKSTNTRAGAKNNIPMALREKRKSVADDRAVEDANEMVYIQNETVHYSVKKRDFEKGYKHIEKPAPGGRRRISGRQTDLETFWETSDEDMVVGDDANALNYKRNLAKRNSLSQNQKRKRRIGVDESAKAVVMMQEVKASQHTCLVQANVTVPKIDYTLPESVDLDSENKENDKTQQSYKKERQQCQSLTYKYGIRTDNRDQIYPSILDNIEKETIEEPVSVSAETQLETCTIPGSRSNCIDPVQPFDGSHVMITKM